MLVLALGLCVNVAMGPCMNVGAKARECRRKA